MDSAARLIPIMCLYVSLCSAGAAPKLFIEPRNVKGREVSLEMTRELSRGCPSAVVVTKDEASADLRLAITPGATTLFRADGSVEKIFGVRFMLSRLGKQVCGYLKSR